MIERGLLGLLATNTAQDSFNTEHELLHREWLGDIVVGTNLEAFEDVFLQLLGGQEDDWYVGVSLTNLGCEGEAIFLWHHHIEHTDVILGLEELSIAYLSVWAECCCIAFSLKVLTKEHTQILVVLTQ